ncbi:MAG TPA: hypothetical protein PLV51_05880 [Lentimicrobium sp.]|jgi:hypothetical protein|nr:hypothetical protein [Lentimicrobium sp.]
MFLLNDRTKFSITFSFLFLLMLISVIASAQYEDYSIPEDCKSRSGLEYGATAGFYIPGNGSANFYSGKPGNENNIEYVFRNTYWYNEIYQMLDANDKVILSEYPENMKYNPAFIFGLFAKYDLNCHTGIYIQFTNAKLRAKDVFSVEVDPPIDYLAEPDIRLFPVYGTEERNLADLGITYSPGNKRAARLMLGGGVSMNSTLVKESVVRIEGKVYDMVNKYSGSYIPGSGQMVYDIRQGGIGFGVFGTVGGRFEFSNAIAIEPGFTVYYKKISLESASGFYPQYVFFVRLCLRDLISFE